MRRIIPELGRITTLAFYVGTAGVILFGIGRLVSAPDNFPAVYKGSWQRLYVWVYYVDITIVAI
jgi:hypothetical protein